MSHNEDPFAPAVETAHEWLAKVARQLGTDDRRFAHRVLRAWLHAVRDRIGVNSAAHLSAQLPALLRGEFFEGWQPSHVPTGHDPIEFVDQFARSAGVTRGSVAGLAGLVTDALDALFSPGQLDRIFATFPLALQDLLSGDERAVDFEDEYPPFPKALDPQVRIGELEQQIAALSDAVTVLSREQGAVTTGRVTRRIVVAQQASGNTRD